MFVTVAKVGEIAPGSGRQVTIGERWVGLFNIDGAYLAVDSVCLHRGGPLCEGAIKGSVVTCPWHGWQYELTTGTLIQDPVVGVTRHETRIVGDDVQVRLTD